MSHDHQILAIGIAIGFLLGILVSLAYAWDNRQAIARELRRADKAMNQDYAWRTNRRIT